MQSNHGGEPLKEGRDKRELHIGAGIVEAVLSLAHNMRVERPE